MKAVSSPRPRVFQILTPGSTSWKRSLSPLTMMTSRPWRRARRQRVAMRSSASNPGRLRAGIPDSRTNSSTMGNWISRSSGGAFPVGLVVLIFFMPEGWFSGVKGKNQTPWFSTGEVQKGSSKTEYSGGGDSGLGAERPVEKSVIGPKNQAVGIHEIDRRTGSIPVRQRSLRKPKRKAINWSSESNTNSTR